MKANDLLKAIANIEDSRLISNDVILAALQEGLEKAYRKQINCPDAVVRLEIKDDDTIHLYQRRTVVEEVDDDEIEIAYEEIKREKPNVQLGDVLEEEVNISEFGRSSVTLFKNVMLQKIKEASKQVIYDEYIDKVSDLVWGTIETVEEKFVLVNLGKTLAIMLKNDQIPGERYFDGQRLQVVIKAVNKESKGSQVMVSRSSADLVKRLFENYVPEIYDGTVVIKAIAREAGERTKMVVYSNNVNVDAIGSCIGPRGNRVISVIEAITQKNNPSTHESIDIVEWNPNYIEYVKNIMKPANILAVIGNDKNENLLVVVENDQLSLAIGKRGINAKLAVKLLGRKIDIKTQSDVEAEGIDWYGEMVKAQMEEIARLTASRRKEEAAEVTPVEEIKEPENVKETVETVAEPVVTEVVPEPVVETVAEEKPETVVKPVEKETKVEEEQQAEDNKEVTKRRKPKLTVKASDYVSKFEEFADAKKAEQTTTTKKKKKTTKNDDDQIIKEKLASLKNKEYEIRPEYTEEELEEFNNAEDEHWYDDDVDYDEYDEFYDN